MKYTVTDIEGNFSDQVIEAYSINHLECHLELIHKNRFPDSDCDNPSNFEETMRVTSAKGEVMIYLLTAEPDIKTYATNITKEKTPEELAEICKL